MINDFLNLAGIDTQHQNQHKLLFGFSQGVIEKVFTTVPTTDEVPEGYLAKYNSGATYRIYINFNGTMKYWALT